MNKLSFIADLSQLPEIRSFIREELNKMNVMSGLCEQIVLAMDEACSNSIIHQHHNDGVSVIKLIILKKRGQVLLELHDNGTPFPLDNYNPLDIAELIKSKQKGKLGVHIIHKVMDKVEVVTSETAIIYRFTKLIGSL